MLFNKLAHSGLLVIFFSFASISSFAQSTSTHHSSEQLLNSIRSVVSNSTLSDEDALLTGFRLGFNRKAIDQPVSREFILNTLGKCGTDLVKTFHQSKSSLSPSVVSEIESYLLASPTEVSSVYLSPSGRFKLTYVTTGADAVPSADSNANGKPDYVERVAIYFDQSWDKEVTELGFAAPPATSANPYEIGFEEMEYYGYTEPVSGTNGTHIVMHRNFSGFPANDDPEGDAIGAAKVTAAHEFKHALQFMSSGWNGESSNWLEMDATWAEDLVYDYVNDYYNYLDGAGNIFTTPATTLNPGSYEDATFAHYFSQSNSDLFWVEVWKAIENNNAITMVDAMSATLNSLGKSFQLEFNNAYVWHVASGTRARTGFGFDEAGKFPNQTVNKTHSAAPVSGTQTGTSLAKLSGNIIVIKPVAIPANDSLLFDGADGGNLGVSLMTYKNDGTLVVESFVPDLVTKKVNVKFTVPDSDVKEIVLVVTNHNNTAATTFKYSPGVLANYLMYGDLNSSLTVNAFDASAVLKNAAGSIPAYTGDKFIAADVSGNKSVSAYDATFILQKSVGLIQFFPADINKDGFGPEVGGSKINTVQLNDIVVKSVENGYLISSKTELPVSSLDIRISGFFADLQKIELVPLFSNDYLIEKSINTVKNGYDLTFAVASGSEFKSHDIFKLLGSSQVAENLTLQFSANESDFFVADLNSETDGISIPSKFIVDQNYPNPFNPSTSIRFGLPASQVVSVKIYNLLGQDLSSILPAVLNAGKEFSAGFHSIQINSGALPSGTYIYQIKAGSFVQTRKMTLLK